MNRAVVAICVAVSFLSAGEAWRLALAVSEQAASIARLESRVRAIEAQASRRKQSRGGVPMPPGMLPPLEGMGLWKGGKSR